MYADKLRLLRNCIVRERTISINTTTKKILDGDPNRIAVSFVCHATIAAIVKPGYELTSQLGFCVDPTGGKFTFTIEELGAMIGQPWYGSSASSFFDLTIYEVVWLDPGPETETPEAA